MTDNLPAHLAGRAKPTLARALVQSFGTSLPPHVSIRGDRFTLVDGAGNERPIDALHLDCAVVDFNPNPARMYWGGRDYDPEDRAPPVCFSDNGVGASSRAQSPQSTSCQACPHSVWGSATSKISGKGIPACQNGIKLAVIVPGDPGDLCYMLRVPPNSIVNARNYAKMIEDGQNIELCDIVTRITFAKEPRGTLEFKAAAWIDEPTMRREEALWEKKATRSVIGLDDVPWKGTGLEQADRLRVPSTQHLPLPPAAPPARGENGGGATQQPAPVAAPFQAAVPSGGLPGGDAQRAAEAKGPGRPRGSTKKPPAPTSGAMAIPPFLQRAPVVPAAPPPPKFGIQPGAPAPNADLKAALDAAMNLK